MKKRFLFSLFSFLIFAPITGYAQEGQLIEPQKAQRPVWLGVQLLPDLSNEPGARVGGILRNSPVDGAGLRKGDRIIAFGDQKVASAASLQKITKQHRDGDKVVISFLRITTTRKATIVLEAMPDSETIVRKHLVGEKAPPLHFRSKGKKVNLSSGKGRITVVDFWATWCGPCREIDVELQKTLQKFGDKIRVVSISNQDEKTVNAFLKKHPKKGVQVGIDFDDASDTYWHISAYPTLVLLDENQKVVSVMFGTREAQLLDAKIQKLLNTK